LLPYSGGHALLGARANSLIAVPNPGPANSRTSAANTPGPDDASALLCWAMQDACSTSFPAAFPVAEGNGLLKP
jgi:hypothetical protein